MKTTSTLQHSTLCVHQGGIADPGHGGVSSPVFPASAYAYRGQADCPYPRYFNTPNQLAVVAKLCALEKAEDGLLFASGMAAISTAILTFAGNGDHVVLLDSLYGGTHALASEVLGRFGIRHSFVASSTAAIATALTPATRLIVLESPTNPLLEIVDIAEVARHAAQHGILTLCDNTFATPILQNPLALGIDLVVHSGTKYLGGHNDLCSGVLLGRIAHISSVRQLARQLGGSLDAQAAALMERSLKTLDLRVRRQSQTALQLAQWLTGTGRVAQVYYPGLPDFPGHALAAAQMRAFGGMLSFRLLPGTDPEQFLDRLQLIQPAVSLGGLESIICSPAQTSHAEMSAAERARIGIDDRLLRLSVGIEDAGDLQADLQQALAG